jgi:hypothetical protein
MKRKYTQKISHVLFVFPSSSSFMVPCFPSRNPPTPHPLICRNSCCLIDAPPFCVSSSSLCPHFSLVTFFIFCCSCFGGNHISSILHTFVFCVFVCVLKICVFSVRVFLFSSCFFLWVSCIFFVARFFSVFFFLLFF